MLRLFLAAIVAGTHAAPSQEDIASLVQVQPMQSLKALATEEQMLKFVFMMRMVPLNPSDPTWGQGFTGPQFWKKGDGNMPKNPPNRGAPGKRGRSRFAAMFKAEPEKGSTQFDIYHDGASYVDPYKTVADTDYFMTVYVRKNSTMSKTKCSVHFGPQRYSPDLVKTVTCNKMLELFEGNLEDLIILNDHRGGVITKGSQTCDLGTKRRHCITLIDQGLVPDDYTVEAPTPEIHDVCWCTAWGDVHYQCKCDPNNPKRGTQIMKFDYMDLGPHDLIVHPKFHAQVFHCPLNKPDPTKGRIISIQVGFAARVGPHIVSFYDDVRIDGAKYEPEQPGEEMVLCLVQEGTTAIEYYSAPPAGETDQCQARVEIFGRIAGVKSNTEWQQEIKIVGPVIEKRSFVMSVNKRVFKDKNRSPTGTVFDINAWMSEKVLSSCSGVMSATKLSDVRGLGYHSGGFDADWFLGSYAEQKDMYAKCCEPFGDACDIAGPTEPLTLEKACEPREDCTTPGMQQRALGNCSQLSDDEGTIAQCAMDFCLCCECEEFLASCEVAEQGSDTEVADLDTVSPTAPEMKDIKELPTVTTTTVTTTTVTTTTTTVTTTTVTTTTTTVTTTTVTTTTITTTITTTTTVTTTAAPTVPATCPYGVPSTFGSESSLVIMVEVKMVGTVMTPTERCDGEGLTGYQLWKAEDQPGRVTSWDREKKHDAEFALLVKACSKYLEVHWNPQHKPEAERYDLFTDVLPYTIEEGATYVLTAKFRDNGDVTIELGKEPNKVDWSVTEKADLFGKFGSLSNYDVSALKLVNDHRLGGFKYGDINPVDNGTSRQHYVRLLDPVAIKPTVPYCRRPEMEDLCKCTAWGDVHYYCDCYEPDKKRVSKYDYQGTGPHRLTFLGMLRADVFHCPDVRSNKWRSWLVSIQVAFTLHINYATAGKSAEISWYKDVAKFDKTPLPENTEWCISPTGSGAQQLESGLVPGDEGCLAVVLVKAGYMSVALNDENGQPINFKLTKKKLPKENSALEYVIKVEVILPKSSLSKSLGTLTLNKPTALSEAPKHWMPKEASLIDPDDLENMSALCCTMPLDCGYDPEPKENSLEDLCKLKEDEVEWDTETYDSLYLAAKAACEECDNFSDECIEDSCGIGTITGAVESCKDEEASEPDLEHCPSVPPGLTPTVDPAPAPTPPPPVLSTTTTTITQTTTLTPAPTPAPFTPAAITDCADEGDPSTFGSTQSYKFAATITSAGCVQELGPSEVGIKVFGKGSPKAEMLWAYVMSCESSPSLTIHLPQTWTVPKSFLIPSSPGLSVDEFKIDVRIRDNQDCTVSLTNAAGELAMSTTFSCPAAGDKSLFNTYKSNTYLFGSAQNRRQARNSQEVCDERRNPAQKACIFTHIKEKSATLDYCKRPLATCECNAFGGVYYDCDCGGDKTFTYHGRGPHDLAVLPGLASQVMHCPLVQAPSLAIQVAFAVKIAVAEGVFHKITWFKDLKVNGLAIPFPPVYTDQVKATLSLCLTFGGQVERYTPANSDRCPVYVMLLQPEEMKQVMLIVGPQRSGVTSNIEVDKVFMSQMKSPVGHAMTVHATLPKDEEILGGTMAAGDTEGAAAALIDEERFLFTNNTEVEDMWGSCCMSGDMEEGSCGPTQEVPPYNPETDCTCTATKEDEAKTFCEGAQPALGELALATCKQMFCGLCLNEEEGPEAIPGGDKDPEEPPIETNPTATVPPTVTFPPTPAPTPPAPTLPPAGTNGDATSSGDPHCKNVRGENFDVRTTGEVTFVAVPRGAHRGHDLKVTATVAPVNGHPCSPTVIKKLRVEGAWLGGAPGLVLVPSKGKAGVPEIPRSWRHFLAQEGAKNVTLEARGNIPRMNLRIGGDKLQVNVKQRHGFASKIRYLDVQIKGLKSLGDSAGGILGLDDHSAEERVLHGCDPHAVVRLARDQSEEAAATGRMISLAEVVEED